MIDLFALNIDVFGVVHAGALAAYVDLKRIYSMFNDKHVLL